MQRKGSNYEREIAKKLSLWWSQGRRDDLCWRTAGSGARAHVRAKQDKLTEGHHGDLAATSSEMEPFFKLVTIEIKRGYNNTANLLNLLLDGNKKTKSKNTYNSFIIQSIAAAYRSGTRYWMLIHKPDRKEPIVFIPASFDIIMGFFFEKKMKPYAKITTKVTEFFIVPLDRFLQIAEPHEFVTAWEIINGKWKQ